MGKDKIRREFLRFSRTEFANNIRVKCERCYCSGEDFKIEIHHKKPIALGGNNDLDNLISLCYDCHKEVHRNEEFYKNTNITDIKTIEEQKILKLIDEIGRACNYEYSLKEREEVFYKIKAKYAKEYIKAFRFKRKGNTAQSKGIENMPVNKDGQRYSVKTGNLLGRKKMTQDTLPVDFYKTYKRLKVKNTGGTLTTEEAATILKISRSTLYRYTRFYESELKLNK